MAPSANDDPWCVGDMRRSLITMVDFIGLTIDQHCTDGSEVSRQIFYRLKSIELLLVVVIHKRFNSFNCVKDSARAEQCRERTRHEPRDAPQTD
jgi:hypothetical protein